MNKKIYTFPSCIKKMSSLKKTFLIFLILFLFLIFVDGPFKNSSDKLSKEYFIPKLNIESVTKISVLNPSSDKNITLSKKSNKWWINSDTDFLADDYEIHSFLSVLRDLEQGDQISNNKGRENIFKVDEAQANHIKLFSKDNKILTDIYVGKASDNGQYIRNNNSNKVFKTSPYLLSYLNKSLEDWKDKTLMSLDSKNIVKISIEKNNEELLLENRNDTWYAIKPKEYLADHLAIRSLLDQIHHLKGDSFATEEEFNELNFDNFDYKISAYLKDGSENVVLFKAKDSEDHKDYFAKTSNNDFIYKISEPLVNNIFSLNFEPTNNKEDLNKI